MNQLKASHFNEQKCNEIISKYRGKPGDLLSATLKIIPSERYGFSNLTLETEFNPSDNISVDLEAAWSPYDSHFKELNLGAALKDNREDSITCEYRYKAGDSESLYTKIDLKLTDEIKGFYSVEENFKTDETIEQNEMPETLILKPSYNKDKKR